MKRLRRLCEWVGRRRFPAIPVAVGLVLVAPSLWVGLQSDDLMIRATVLGLHREEVVRRPWEAFTFLTGDPAENERMQDMGWMPFWLDLRCRAAFFRPLTTLTHMADHYGWPGLPWLMHVQSLAWFGLLLWAVAALYRRLMGRALPLWTAALAALLFAVDDGHGIPAGWLANRNAVLACLFGTLALLAHDRWRTDGWRAGAALAPLALLAALLAKEEAVCACAYLAGYALFLDRGTRRRLLSLLPYLAVAVAWYAVYRALGYGVARSAMYVDPGRDPLRFLRRAANAAPLLLLGQWGVPDSDASSLLSAAALRVHWFWAVGFLGVMALLLAPLLRGSRLARFWAFGMVASVLPACAPFPSDRLLMFVGLGAAPLLSEWLAGRSERAGWLPASRAWRAVARVAAPVLVAINLVLSPLALPVEAVSFRFIGQVLDRHFESLPADEALRGQTVIFAASFMSLADYMWQMPRIERGLPLPRRTLQLSASGSGAAIRRADARTLVVRPHQGYLCPPRGVPGQEHREPTFSARPINRLFDALLRAPDDPLPLGYAVDVPDATITVTALTPDGRPAEATFRFKLPLEHPTYRWLVLTKRGFVPFQPPAVGETVSVASPLP